ncbi:ammonia-dependent NAD(+) synthetase [Kribbia dieselivorans]|uniref:ammonia-dependent NAD(+) synthetase n=1 Tax=Kribbia dieselivorans TaxID=331526 RepID=UPI00083991F2|nr:ammonia-dependent NAD(+) synthetase [Kribbia dieselivorans]
MTDVALQQRIIAEMEIPTRFDAHWEIERRIDFLADYLTRTRTSGFVLGISGGVDSTAAGRLAQLACERVRADGGTATFVAMRLPYGVQADEADAQAALDFIAADEVLTVNIKDGVDGLWDATIAGGLSVDTERDDFVKGNVKARMRMIAQYTVAGARNLIVLGTDHGAESVVGFFTKFGDGGADVLPLFGLNKRRVRGVCAALGAPEAVWQKVPTADLEDDKPLRPDEVALGVSYDAIDDYLEGKDVSEQDEATILGWYGRTAHKRALPVTIGLAQPPA